MSAKRKRQDEDPSNLRPLPALLEALKGGDLVAVQSAIPQLQAYNVACRKAPESPPAKMLEKQLLLRKSLPELLAAFDYALANNNKALLSSLCNYTRSLLSLRVVNLAPFQHELGLEVLDKAGPAIQKALQPGHNEANATALSLLGVLVRDLTEDHWSSKARQVWTLISTDAKNLVRLLSVRHTKSVRQSKKTDVRTLVMGIFVPLLSPQSPVQLREDLLSIKGLLPATLKGLAEDEPPVVYGFLHVLFFGGIQGQRITIEQRCAVAESTWQPLLLLTAPAFEDKAQYARRFLLATITSLAAQAQGSSIPIIRKTMFSLLSALRPGENQIHAELTLTLVQHNPELVNSFWQRLFPSLDPRLSSRWIATVTLATRIVCIAPASSIHTSSFEFIMDSCFPLTITQAWCSKGLAFDNPLVSYLVGLFLIASLQKAQNIIDALEKQPSTRNHHIVKRMRNSLAERLPDPKTVINLLQKSVSDVASQGEDSLCLLTYLRLVKLYHLLVPETASALRFDFTKLVEPLISQASPEDPFLCSAQLVFLQLALVPGIQIHWFKGAGANTPIHQLCRLMVLTSTPAVGDAASETLQHILSRSNLFEPVQGLEMSIWICAIRGALPTEAEDSALIGSTSFQKASASAFKCIEETDAMDLGLDGQSISPLTSGWLQQLAYFAEHRLDLKDAVANFSSRVIAGYTGLLSKSATNRLRTLASKSIDVPKKPACPSFVQDVPLLSQPAFWNLYSQTEDLCQRFSDMPVSGSALCALQLRAAYLLERTGSDALPVLQRLLETPAKDSLLLSLSRGHQLSRLEQHCWKKGSEDDKRRFAGLVGVIVNAVQCDETLKQEFSFYLDQLWDKCSSQAGDRLSLLHELLPFTSLQKRKVLLTHLASHPAPPKQALENQLWSALLTSLIGCDDPTLWSKQVCERLILLSSQNGMPQASEVLAKLIGSILPAGLQGQPLDSTTNDLLPLRESINLCLSWVSALLQHQQSFSPTQIRPALALSPASSRHLSDCVQQTSGRTTEGFAESLLRSLVDNIDIFEAANLLASINPILKKSQASLFEQDYELACRTSVILVRSEGINYEAQVIQPAVMWLEALPPMAVTSDLIEAVVKLSAHLHADCKDKMLALLCDKCYLWLVRRFAEDESDSASTVAIVDVLNRRLTDGTLSASHLKGHLASPVITAALQNRLLSKTVMLFTANTLKFLKSPSAVQWAQQVMAHQDLRRALSATSDTRSSTISVILNLLQQLGKFDTPPELYNTLLSCYGGTLAPEDLLIKESFRRVELDGIWSLSQNLAGTSLKLKGMTEVTIGARALAVLDPDLAYASCIYLSHHEAIKDPSNAYDPEFLLSMLAAFMTASEMDVQDFLGLIRANVLGVAICATVSESKKISIAADRILARLRLRLQGAEFTEKEEILLALHHAQSWSGNENASSVSALFLAQCCRATARPEDPRYPVFLRYLLQRSEIDFSDVPLLYQTLYSTEQGKATEERQWILNLLRDGMCQPKDWLALRRRQTWDLLAGLFLNEEASAAERGAIFEFLGRAVLHDVAVSDLIRRSGILSFLQQAAPYLVNVEEERVFAVLRNILTRIRSGRHNSKIWLDALLTIRALTSKRASGSTSRLRCYRGIVLALQKKQVDSHTIDPQICFKLHEALQEEFTVSTNNSEQYIALLHDVILRASYYSLQVLGAEGIRGWDGLLRSVSSKASSYSIDIREYWLKAIDAAQKQH